MTSGGFHFLKVFLPLRNCGMDFRFSENNGNTVGTRYKVDRFHKFVYFFLSGSLKQVIYLRRSRNNKEFNFNLNRYPKDAALMRSVRVSVFWLNE